MPRIDVIVTANSPGEVSGWVKPAAAAIKALPVETRVTVFVPPCTFASGAECGVVRAIPGVDQVFGPNEFLRYILMGIVPRGFEPSPRGVVLFLGGELTNAVILSKKLRYPAVAYTEGFVNWSDSFARFAVPYRETAEKLSSKGVGPDKVKVVGNLMLDAAKAGVDAATVRRTLGVGDAPVLLLLPGSRPAEVELMAPFFLSVAEQVAQEYPAAKTVLSISPFVTDDQLSRVISSPNAREFGQTGTYTPGAVDDSGATSLSEPGLIRSAAGVAIPAFRGRQYDLMNITDLALTIPGTNTVELSFFGVPMVVALPLNHPERIPLEGLVGLIGNLPKLGKEVKRRILPRVLAKIKHAAWPNRLAQEFIVPEVRGKISPDDVTSVAVGLLSDSRRREDIKGRLRAVVGEPGASRNLASLLEEVLQERYGDAWKTKQV